MLSIYGRIQCLKINIKKIKQYKANQASRRGVKFNKASNETKKNDYNPEILGGVGF